MDKLRRALSGDDGRDDDSATGILPVSSFKNYRPNTFKGPFFIIF